MNNIHPLLVHFPIALLTIYALFEVLSLPLFRLGKFTATESARGIKAFLVIVGALATTPALWTGDSAEHAVLQASKSGRGSDLARLIDIHSTFAGVTTAVFAILAVIYLSALLVSWTTNTKSAKFFVNLDSYIGRFRNPYVLSLFALIGLALVTVTGALGGAIVYGPDIDPVVRAIYNLFF